MKSIKEITDKKDVNNKLFDFLLKNDKRRPKHDIARFFSLIQKPCLTAEQSAKCEISISEDELICALTNMPKNTSPGNDGLTKEFYGTFRDKW